MVKIEAKSLEDAYAKAAKALDCSVTQLQVEIIQYPSKGILGLFKKPAIIVAGQMASQKESQTPEVTPARETQVAEVDPMEDRPALEASDGDLIMPDSFVTGQDDEEDAEHFGTETNVDDHFFDARRPAIEIADEVRDGLNQLFETACFDIDPVQVSLYDTETLLIEFTGKDAALLIGKEGYRYKALSYMLFNWINSTYQMQLRLEIAEFLKNQEESINRYLIGVCESIDRDGKAQTKILDGVLVQIALRELRERYPDKYVAIRSTRDGSKFIIVNNYNEY